MEDYTKKEDTMQEDIELEDIELEDMEEEEDTEQENSSSGGHHHHKHCYKLKRVYDWRKLVSDKFMDFAIPPTDLPGIEDALAAGHELTVLADIHEISSKVISVDRHSRFEREGCITIEKIANVHVRILDESDGSLLSTFFRNVRFFDSTEACIPFPLNINNVELKIVEYDAKPISNTIFEGTVTVEISICQDIEVFLIVKAKLKTYGLCKSKAGVPCSGSVPCPHGQECSRFNNPRGCHGSPGTCHQG